MKTFSGLLFSLLFIPFSGAQGLRIDSLKQLYLNTTSDTRRFELLSELAAAAFDTDISTALSFARQGASLAEKSNDQVWKSRFYEICGRGLAHLNQLDSANYYFKKALKSFVALGDKKGQANTYFKTAWIYKRKGQNDKAIDADLKALRLMEEINYPEGIARASGRISEDLLLQGLVDDAMDYALRGIDICIKNQLDHEILIHLKHAGDVSIQKEDYQQALKYYDEALILTSHQKDTLLLADITGCRGNAFKKMGNYPQALKDFYQSLDLARKANYKGGIATANAHLGEVHLLMKNYKDALSCQLKTIEILEANGDATQLTGTYGQISAIYENLGNFQLALQFQKKARQMRDSIASVKSDLAISYLRTQYETEKKEATISAQELQLKQQHQMQFLYLGITALLGLLAFTFYKNAISRKKSNQQLAAKIAENELLLKEIHHRVKNNLEVVSSLLELQSSQISDPGIKEAMQEGQNRVQSIGIVHQKLYQSHNLASVEMKDYFIHLGESILDSFGASDRIDIVCNMDQLELDIDTAIPLGLIANEVLTNAIKYAFPDGRRGRIEIQLVQRDDNTLHLKIADNGIGKSKSIMGTGFGTQLLSLLIRQLNGSTWEEVKEGTIIYFDFTRKKSA